MASDVGSKGVDGRNFEDSNFHRMAATRVPRGPRSRGSHNAAGVSPSIREPCEAVAAPTLLLGLRRAEPASLKPPAGSRLNCDRVGTFIRYPQSLKDAFEQFGAVRQVPLILNDETL